MVRVLSWLGVIFNTYLASQLNRYGCLARGDLCFTPLPRNELLGEVPLSPHYLGLETRMLVFVAAGRSECNNVYSILYNLNAV